MTEENKKKNEAVPESKPKHVEGKTIDPDLKAAKDFFKPKKDGFFSFRKMVSPSLIKIIYVFGMIGVMVAGILRFIPPKGEDTPSILNIIIGLGLITVGNFVWRIFCENWILLFSIHEVLVSIEGKLKK